MSDLEKRVGAIENRSTTLGSHAEGDGERRRALIMGGGQTRIWRQALWRRRKTWRRSWGSTLRDQTGLRDRPLFCRAWGNRVQHRLRGAMSRVRQANVLRRMKDHKDRDTYGSTFQPLLTGASAQSWRGILKERCLNQAERRTNSKSNLLPPQYGSEARKWQGEVRHRTPHRRRLDADGWTRTPWSTCLGKVSGPSGDPSRGLSVDYVRQKMHVSLLTPNSGQGLIRTLLTPTFRVHISNIEKGIRGGYFQNSFVTEQGAGGTDHAGGLFTPEESTSHDAAQDPQLTDIWGWPHGTSGEDPSKNARPGLVESHGDLQKAQILMIQEATQKKITPIPVSMPQGVDPCALQEWGRMERPGSSDAFLDGDIETTARHSRSISCSSGRRTECNWHSQPPAASPSYVGRSGNHARRLGEHAGNGPEESGDWLRLQ